MGFLTRLGGGTTAPPADTELADDMEAEEAEAEEAGAEEAEAEEAGAEEAGAEEAEAEEAEEEEAETENGAASSPVNHKDVNNRIEVVQAGFNAEVDFANRQHNLRQTTPTEHNEILVDINARRTEEIQRLQTLMKDLDQGEVVTQRQLLGEGEE